MQKTLKKRIRRGVPPLVLAVFVGLGCGGEEGAETPEVPESAAASAAHPSELNGWWNWIWSQPSSQGPYLDMGPDTDRTCFLTGVGGDLNSLYGEQAPPGTSYSSASVNIYRSKGRWVLYTGDASGMEQMKATALCLRTTAGRTSPVAWSEGLPAAELGAVTASRRCFLTGISNQDMWYENDNFSSSGDSVQVFTSNGKWYIGGTGHALGTAACVDLPNNKPILPYHYIAPSIGGSVKPLLTGSNVQCLLTGISGSFRTSVWTDGVFINYDPGVQQWSMTTTFSKGGWADCVE